MPSTSVPVTTPPSTTVGSTPPPAQTSVANISPEWAAAYTKVGIVRLVIWSSSVDAESFQAKAAVAKLSLTDKVNLGTGIQWQKGERDGSVKMLGTDAYCVTQVLASVTHPPFLPSLASVVSVCKVRHDIWWSRL